MPTYDTSGYGVAQKKAEFAQIFQGATTNLAQRRRYREDIDTFKNMQAAESVALDQERLKSDPDYQRYYFANEKLKMEQSANAFQMAKQAELAPLQIQGQAQRVKTEALRAEAITKKTLLDDKLAEQREAQTSAFLSEVESLDKQGIQFGTPAYRAAIAKARLKNPGVDPKFFGDVWKATDPGDGLTPEEAVKQFESLTTAAPDARVSVRTGGATLSSTPQDEKPAKTVDPMEAVFAEKKRLEGIYGDEARIPAPVLKKLQAKLADAEKAYVGDGAAAAAPARERVVMNPKTGAKLALRNGQWVPL